jgi:hypothetical protein
MEKEITMHKLILIGVIMLVGGAQAANASEYWDGCSGCSLKQQRWKATRAVPSGTVGRFDVYILDFERAAIQKFDVMTAWDPYEDIYGTVSAAVNTEAHIAYEFETLVHAVKQDIARFEAGTRIPEEIAASAYDLVHSNVTRARVSDYINEHLNIWQAIAAPASIPLQALGKIVDLNLVVSVTFADGSAAKFLLSGIEGDLLSISYVFAMLEDSLTDADGNQIPPNSEEAAPYAGVFSTDTNAQEMTNFIIAWYSQQGAKIECRSTVEPDGITVICKRR